MGFINQAKGHEGASVTEDGEGWLPIRDQASPSILLESGHFSALCAEQSQDKALSYGTERGPQRQHFLIGLRFLFLENIISLW